MEVRLYLWRLKFPSSMRPRKIRHYLNMQVKDAELNENLPFEGVAGIVTMDKKDIA